jgi:hypothetical protein
MSGAPGDDTAALVVAADEFPDAFPVEFAEPVAGFDDGDSDDEAAADDDPRRAEQAGSQSDAESTRPPRERDPEY